MKRKECEEKIAELMQEILDTYKQYNPVGDYLSLAIYDDLLMGNNRYYDETSIDYEKQIEFYKYLSEGTGNEKA